MPNIVSDWSSRLLSLHHVAHLVCQFFLFETSTLQTGPPCPSQFRSASGVQINYSLKKKRIKLLMNITEVTRQGLENTHRDSGHLIQQRSILNWYRHIALTQ